eukprot:Opistho-1_new@16511
MKPRGRRAAAGQSQTRRRPHSPRAPVVAASPPDGAPVAASTTPGCGPSATRAASAPFAAACASPTADPSPCEWPPRGRCRPRDARGVRASAHACAPGVQARTCASQHAIPFRAQRAAGRPRAGHPWTPAAVAYPRGPSWSEWVASACCCAWSGSAATASAWSGSVAKRTGARAPAGAAGRRRPCAPRASCVSPRGHAAPPLRAAVRAPPFACAGSLPSGGALPARARTAAAAPRVPSADAHFRAPLPPAISPARAAWRPPSPPPGDEALPGTTAADRHAQRRPRGAAARRRLAAVVGRRSRPDTPAERAPAPAADRQQTEGHHPLGSASRRIPGRAAAVRSRWHPRHSPCEWP